MITDLTLILIGRTLVPDGGELMRRRIRGQPLLHLEIMLRALLMDAGDRHLQIITVPSVARTRPVGGQVQRANGRCQTRASAAEYVEISPLEVVVSRAHEPAPGLDVVNPDPVSRRIVESGGDYGVRPAFDDRAGSDVQCVHTICIILQIKF